MWISAIHRATPPDFARNFERGKGLAEVLNRQEETAKIRSIVAWAANPESVMKTLSFRANWLKWHTMPAEPPAQNNDSKPLRNGNGNGSVTTAAFVATLRTMRQLFILLIGLTVLLLGVVMIFLPGPSILVIPLGLAILGIEFAWARRWLEKFKSYLPKRKPKALPAAGALPQIAPAPDAPAPSAHPSSSAESPLTRPSALPR